MAEQGKTKVLVIDDHAVFVDALSRTLSSEGDIEVVATAATASEGVEAFERSVDVVLCDFRLPDADGVAVTRNILEQDPDARVVMLTASTDDAVLVAAIDAGCTGFLAKTASLSEVLDAVRSAASGESVVSPALLSRLLPRMTGSGGTAADDLTPRELEVIAEMAKGGSNQQIADALFVSRDTVRNHVANILRKLDAHSKLEAVSIAARRGIIRLGPGL